MTLRTEIPLFILAALALAFAFVLILTGHAVPVTLWAVVTAALGVGAGLATPGSASSKKAGFTMPTDQEIQDITKTVGALFPPLMTEISSALDGMDAPAPPAPPGAPASVTSIVRPTEPPTAS